MIDGVFYNKYRLDFNKILNDISKILGDDVKVRSLEYPEISAIIGDDYYYRCGFTLDKKVDRTYGWEELDEIKKKISELFPEDTYIYTLNCEVISENEIYEDKNLKEDIKNMMKK